jgi:adenylate cyclase, class 2
MKEVEVKILEIDREKIEKTLIGLNAKKVLDDDILTLFFDFKDGNIWRGKDVLRLRQDRQKIELTYKRVCFEKETKVAEEYTVQVSDLDTATKILQNLGLSIIEKMEKHRTSYILGDVRFDIDRYSGDYAFIPEFLEIEGALELIHKYALILGFQANDCLPWSTDDLIRFYAKEENVNKESVS